MSISSDNVHNPTQPTTSSKAKQTLIDQYKEDYEKALSAIDNDVKALVQQGKEMKSLILMSENLGKIIEIHESLSRLYTIIYNNTEVLKRFGSERLKQLGHEPKPIYEVVKDANAEKEDIENYVVQELRKVGFSKKHWYIKERILSEIEYMFDALQILIEPEFIPLEDTSTELNTSDDGNADRYIPSSVKISVWRRDQGKCIQCGSKEKLEYDHIIPISKGGANTERNVQLLCEKCNREKSARIA